MSDVGEVNHGSEDVVVVIAEFEDDVNEVDYDDSDFHGDHVVVESESGPESSDSQDESDDDWSTQEEPGIVEPGGLAVFGKFCIQLCKHIRQRVNSNDLGYNVFFIPDGKVEVGLNPHAGGGLVNRTPPHGVMVLSHSAVTSKFHYQDETHWAKVLYTPLISQETQTAVVCIKCNQAKPSNDEESTSETA